MSQSFAQWLRAPHRDQRGTIQQPAKKFKFGYIKPDAFPEERLYFRFADWPITVLHGTLQGRPVMFDTEPENWGPEIIASATNVRLMPATPPSPEARPVYTTSS